MKLKLLGTEAHPIHMSSLPTLTNCQWQWLMQFCDPFDVGGPAADTGTAVGRAIELWHAGKEIHEALRQVAVEAVEGNGRHGNRPFAQYNADEVQRMAMAYTNDPRNTVRVVGQELKLKVVLDPHPLDQTREPIILVGSNDQLRDRGAYRELWDVKSGKPAGGYMTNMYACQQAGYLIGLQDTEFAPVRAGGIIRLRDYLTRKAQAGETPQVFYRYAMDLEISHALLDQFRLIVAALRHGEVAITPGTHCGYCLGLVQCWEKFKEWA